MINNNSFKINIHFIGNKHLSIRNAILFINIDEEDEWGLANSDSMMAFENTVIKIRDLDQEKELFLFLINANIIIKENEININSFSKLELYKQNNKIKFDNLQIKEITTKINYYESLQKIGLSLDQFLEEKHLKQRLYMQKNGAKTKISQGGKLWN